MSRSRRKTPITGWTTARSEKADKRATNKKLRRRNKSRLQATGSADSFVRLREVSDRWCFAKDGKQRFDEAAFPKGMHK